MFNFFKIHSVFLLTLVLGASAFAETKDIPPEMKDAQIVEKLGSQVDLQGLEFTDESGQKVQLSSFFKQGKPVLFTVIYFGCPGLCNYFLNGFTNSIRALEYTAGKEFEIVTLSMDPTENSKMALAKKASYLKVYGRLEAEKGWHWLVGDEESIQKVTASLGFGYKLDKATGEYQHSAGFFVLTPEGKISRVLYGIDFPYRDLKLSILEAGEGKIGSLMDKVLMFCFKYDPFARGYSLYAMRVAQVLFLLTFFTIVFFLTRYWTRERKRQLASRGV